MKRLELAKWQASALFTKCDAFAQRRFRNYAVRKYRCKPRDVTFDTSASVKRIRGAVLYNDDPNMLGRTDGITIEINSCCQMTHSEIIAALLHEARHDWCRVRGKYMSCANEHCCMSKCGDPNE